MIGYYIDERIAEVPPCIDEGKECNISLAKSTNNKCMKKTVSHTSSFKMVPVTNAAGRHKTSARQDKRRES